MSMYAQTHHVMILDEDDPAVLAYCRVKQLRHPDAKIWSYTEFAGGQKAFDETDWEPWKLHIIEHGSAGQLTIHGHTYKEVAEAIVKSGLPDQPTHQHPPKIKLDMCYSGLDKDLNRDAPGSVVWELAGHLSLEMKQDQKITVEGMAGVAVGAWNVSSGGRKAINPNAAGITYMGNKLEKKDAGVNAQGHPVARIGTVDPLRGFVDLKLDNAGQPIKSYSEEPANNMVTPEDVAFCLWTWATETKGFPSSYQNSPMDVEARATDAWKNGQAALRLFYDELKRFNVQCSEEVPLFVEQENKRIEKTVEGTKST